MSNIASFNELKHIRIFLQYRAALYKFRYWVELRGVEYCHAD